MVVLHAGAGAVPYERGTPALWWLRNTVTLRGGRHLVLPRGRSGLSAGETIRGEASRHRCWECGEWGGHTSRVELGLGGVGWGGVTGMRPDAARGGRGVGRCRIYRRDVRLCVSCLFTLSTT